MEFFNNREIATAIWVTIALLATLLKANIRPAIFGVISSFLVKPIILILVLVLSITIANTYLLFLLDLWGMAQLKGTVYWYFTVGVISVFRANSARNDSLFFRKAFFDCFRVFLLIQFVLSIYTFSLIGELIFIPIITIFAVFHGFIEAKDEYIRLRPASNLIMQAFGYLIIGLTAYGLYTDFGKFGNDQNFMNFLVPLYLSVTHIPILYLIIVVTDFEMVFGRLERSLKDPDIASSAKVLAFCSFFFDRTSLKRWINHCSRNNIASIHQVWDSILFIKKRIQIEKLRPHVEQKLGWSPFLAQEFLLEQGLFSKHYDRMYDDLWLSSSNYLKGDDISDPSISYVVEGDSNVAKVLTLEFDDFYGKHTIDDLVNFSEISKSLSLAATADDLPEEIVQAISTGTSCQLNTNNNSYDLQYKKSDKFGIEVNLNIRRFINS